MTEILNEPEVETTPSPTVEDLATVCDSLVTGIRMCLKRIAGDDIFKRRLEGMIDEVSMIGRDIALIVDNSNREYNAAIDEIEALEASNGLLTLRITELNKELDGSAQATALMLESERAAHHKKRTELEEELRQQVEGNEVLESTTRTLVAEKRIILARLEEYERLQPKKLKDDNAKLKIKNADLTKNNSNLNTELTRHYKAHNRLQTDLATSESHVIELTADLDEYQRFDNLINGEHVIERFCMVSQKNALVAFYPYIFKWGLNVWEGEALMEPKRRNEYDLMFIQGLDFHIQIRSTLGIDITCKMSEFGRALYLLPDELKTHWPDGMDTAIQDFHLEQLERLSPELYARCMWCREQKIDDLPFVPEKFRAELVAMGLTDLMMIGGCTFEEIKHLKGMGAATFNKIREGAIQMLEAYNVEHGNIPLTITRKHPKPPMYKRIQEGLKLRLPDVKARSKAAGMAGV